MHRLPIAAVTRSVVRGTATPAPLASSRQRGRRPALLASLAAVLFTSGSLSAQTIGVPLGDSARLVVAPGGKLTVPVRLDMASAAGGNLASLTAGLTWNVARLTLDSLRAGTSGASVTSNLTGAAGGTATLGVFTPSGLTASTVLAQAYFTASATTGGSRVTLTPTVAGSEAGTSILGLLRVRNVDVCVAGSGKWGDVTDDGNVNIIDAQQVARYSVGLTISNMTSLTGRGDVTADGSINIIDAQQIARFSVGLSSAARINTAQATVPTVASLALTPSAAQTLAPGGTVSLVAAPRDGTGAELTGCVAVSYASSNPSIATVSSEGMVTGVSAGSATITVTAGSQTQSVAVTVQPLYTLVVGTQPGGGTSNELLSGQPAVQLRDGANALVTATGQSVTVTVASGSGTLSGTTTVPVVNGVATFTDLAVTGTGAHTLRFSAVGALDATSTSFTVGVPTTMRLLVGQTPTQVGTAGTDVTIPLVLDLAGRGSQDLASLQATITWDPAKFTYVANGAGTWVDQNGDAATVTVNTTQVAAGTFTVGGFTNAGTVVTNVLRTITLRPVATGPLVVNAQVTAAGNAAGQNVTVRVRQLGLTSTAAAVASIRLTPTTATLGIGQSVDLVATPLDANGAALSGRTLTIMSSSASIASASANFRVTGVAPGTATITVSCEGRTATATITVSDLVPGLSAAYYVVPPTATAMPAFRTIVPYRTGVVSQLEYPTTAADTNFAGSGRRDAVGAVFEGFITIPSTGSWTFFVEADDKATLFVNDSVVASHDGLMSVAERSGTRTLPAGRHAIRMEYFDYIGAAVLVLRAEGPGFAKAVVPSSMLSRRIEPTQAIGTPELILGVGQTGTQGVTITNSDGSVRTGATITWGSTAPTVATVTSTGALTSVGAGTAYITATVDGKVVGGYVQVRGAPSQSIGAGFSHSCQREGTGTVSCWGNDAVGQLGDGTSGAARATPGAVASSVVFTRVATRWDRNCALTAAGAAHCWGQGASATPTAVGGGLTFSSIVVGFGFSCALTSTGAAHCWGDNGFGQLGDGTTTARATPTAVSGGRTFVQLAAGADHACGVTADGQLYCWGRNVYGALGDGTTTDRAVPTLAAAGFRMATVSAGEYFTCAFTQSGTLYCWGDNRSQQLATGTTANVLTPAFIPGGAVMESVVGAEHHLCALSANTYMYCRGTNADGELGNGTTTALTNLTLINTAMRFTELSLGRSHSCGRTATGATYCWGANAAGQLGDGTTTGRLAPTLVQVPVGTASVTMSQIRRMALVGQNFTLAALPRDGYGNLLTGRTVAWSSSASGVAAVASDGSVTALGAGTATITATVDGKAATSTVVVSALGVQYSSRQWDGNSPAANATAYRIAIDSLMRRAPAAGYCDTLVGEWTSLSNTTCAGGVTNQVAFRMTANFLVASDAVGKRYFRIGLDAGSGSAWFIDGTPMQFIQGDVVSSSAFVGSATLTAGIHSITVIGFEDCCSGAASATMSRDSIAWTPIPGASYVGANLAGRDLAWRNFSNLNFEGADLRRSILVGTAFVNANLTNARLDSAGLNDADFTGATLTGVTFAGAQFNSGTKWPIGFSPAGRGMVGPGLDYSGQNLSGKDWAWRDLQNANFTGADMRRGIWMGVRFMNSNLTNARLDSAGLNDADFTGVTLTGVTFVGAQFNSGTKWPIGFSPAGRGMVGPGLDYSGQNLSGKDWAWRDLQNANFTGADMRRGIWMGVRFMNSNLTNARLDSAGLNDADFTGVTLTGVTFVGAQFNSGTKWPIGFSPAGRGMVGPGLDYSGQNLADKDWAWRDLRNSNFAGSDLRRSQLRGSTLANANLTNARLDSTSLLDTDFTGATLSGTTWVGATFDSNTKWPAGFSPAGRGMVGPGLDYSGQNLTGKDWAWRDLRNSNFAGSDLRRSQLRGSTLANANLTNARLDSTSLLDTDFTGATLSGTTWVGATFDSNTKWPAGFSPAGRGMVGPGLDYSGQNLTGKDWAWRDLRNSNFAGSDLRRSQLRGSTLANSNLTNARLDSTSLLDTDFTGANLSGTTWIGAVYDASTKWPAGFNPAGRGMIAASAPPVVNPVLSRQAGPAPGRPPEAPPAPRSRLDPMAALPDRRQ